MEYIDKGDGYTLQFIFFLWGNSLSKDQFEKSSICQILAFAQFELIIQCKYFRKGQIQVTVFLHRIFQLLPIKKSTKKSTKFFHTIYFDVFLPWSPVNLPTYPTSPLHWSNKKLCINKTGKPKKIISKKLPKPGNKNKITSAEKYGVYLCWSTTAWQIISPGISLICSVALIWRKWTFFFPAITNFLVRIETSLDNLKSVSDFGALSLKLAYSHLTTPVKPQGSMGKR